jgi:hypothetical protein
VTAAMTARPPAAPPALVGLRQQAITPRSDSLELGPLPGAVPSARLHARAMLAEWGLAELADSAESVTAELVGNAVVARQREQRDAPVKLTLLAGLRTVHDTSSAPPVLVTPGTEAEHGRGLILVEAFSASWGWKPVPGGGKVVRALVRGERHE